MSIFAAIQNHPEILSVFFDVSAAAIMVQTDSGYNITGCNGNLPRNLHLPDKPLGRHLADIFCPLEGRRLNLVHSSPEGKMLPQVLKVCYTNILYKCYTFAIEQGYLLLGDRVGGTDNEVLESLSLLNNELSSLSRDLGRKNRELAAANQTIAEMSRTDMLTGLANRRHFQERYEELFAMVRRHGCLLSVILLDLDLFKQVNDSLGHDAGDALLSEFGRVLRENCRQDDFPARFGGEEFIVLLPHTPAAEAMVLGERLRETVAGRDMLPDRQRVTISAGIAELEPEESKESLIQRADQALYRAKQQGRNRCAAAD